MISPEYYIAVCSHNMGEYKQLEFVYNFNDALNFTNSFLDKHSISPERLTESKHYTVYDSKEGIIDSPFNFVQIIKKKESK